MTRTGVLLGLALGFAGLATAAEDKPLHLSASWDVSLDAQGKVVALEGGKRLDAAVREPLQKAIRSWTFEPGRVDGSPASTDTALTLDLSFVPTADGQYSIRIDQARTGGKVGKSTPPRFPREAVRPGLVALVVVKLDYDADGRVTSVEVVPDQGFNTSRALDSAAVKAARQWKVLPEKVAGHGVASSIMTPICYYVEPVGRHVEGDPCPAWTPPGSTSSVGQGEAYALAPTAKLVSEVAGRTL